MTQTPTPKPSELEQLLNKEPAHVLLTQPKTVASSDIVNFNSGTRGGTLWSGKITGAQYYGNNPSDNPIVIKLVSGDMFDWYIMFNFDGLVITKIREGQNSIVGQLGMGQRETISSWRGTALDLVITVHEITHVSPEYARVDIVFGPQNTLSPAQEPTALPSLSKNGMSNQPTRDPSMKRTNKLTHFQSQEPESSLNTVPNQSLKLGSTVVFDSSINTLWVGEIASAATTFETLSRSSGSYRPTRVHLVTDGRSDWFVEFDASLQVTITRVKNGEGSIMGRISIGKKGTIYNWRKTGLLLRVTVHDINASVTPAYVVTEIMFGKGM